MNESIMFEVENFVNANRDITANLDCCFGHTHKNLEEFRFLPAHRLLVLRLPLYVHKIFGPDQAANTKEIIQQNSIIGSGARKDTSEYSFLMAKLIESAEENAVAPKNRFRYDEILQLFSTYIFLCSGRSCYEILAAIYQYPQSTQCVSLQSTFLCLNILTNLVL